MQSGTLTDPATGNVVVARCRRTANAWERARGLLGRPSPGADEGLLIDPCASVHTFFMRAAIDLVYLGDQGEIKKIVAAVPPWRMSFGPGARATLELAAGSASRCGLRIGQHLHWKSDDE